MRGFEQKTFQMDDTNRLAEYISELKNLPNGKATNQKKKCVDGNKAEWASDLRRQAQENLQSRTLARESVRGFESHSCQKTFWTRWGRAFTNSVILERQFKMTVQSKRKQKTRNVIGPLIAEQFKSAQKKGYPAETCKTRLYAWV